ncbi:MAG: IclR family transcriptional regulator [Hyphomicrobiales bacterium]|nr:IclR family transcriptional regulator [Hyphomicrobiales bacterium]
MDEEPARLSTVRAVQRAAAILKSFEGKHLQSLAEITRATGLDKGTTRRLLFTLKAEGFIAQDPRTERYGLGRMIRTLATGIEMEFDLRAIAVPLLSELAAELQITAFLSVYEDHQAVCLERVHDMKGMEVRWWSVGGTLPLNCGGAPKVLLAHQHDDEIRRALKQPLTRLTPASPVNPRVLRAHLATVRERGWDLAVDDVVVGLTALAVPVFDRERRLVCAISIAGLTPQMVHNGKPVHLQRLQLAAARISGRLT